jgi:hypothetical protein
MVRRYAQLDEIDVRENDCVEKGTVIGRAGKSRLTNWPSSWALARRATVALKEDWHAAPDEEHDHGPKTQGSKTDCERGPDTEDGR